MTDIVSRFLDEKAQQIARLVESGQLTEAQGRELIAEAALAASETPSTPASAPSVPKDKPYLDPKWYTEPTRDNVALAAQALRDAGASEADAWKSAALGTHGLDDAKLDTLHQQTVAQAERTAYERWAKSAEGMERLGAQRRAQAAADAERAANLRPELEARGVPVEGVSDAEVLALVGSMEKSAEQARLDNDPAHNQRLAEAPLPAQFGGDAA